MIFDSLFLISQGEIQGRVFFEKKHPHNQLLMFGVTQIFEQSLSQPTSPLLNTSNNLYKEAPIFFPML